MAENDEQTEGTQDVPPPVRRPRRPRHGRVGLGMVLTLSLAGVIFTILVLSLSGRTIAVPDTIRAGVERRINARLEGTPISLGGIEVGVGRDGIPHLLMNDIRFVDLQGGAVAQLNRIGAELSPGRLLRGEVAASSLFLSGAQITIRRTADGSFAFRSDQVAADEAETLPELLERIDRIMASGALASLQEVQAGGIVLTLEDARSGRIWQATNATAIVRKGGEGLNLSVASDVFNGTDDLAGIQFSVSRNRGTGRVSLGFTVTGMPAGDIALQSPVLSWLSVLDAPISGSVRTEIDETGQLLSFAGTLDIASGALQPTEEVTPVAFEAARAYFTFNPSRQRIDFSEISIVGPEGRLLASGHTYLDELDGPWPRAFLGQFRVEALDYEGGGIFEAPVTLTDVRADLRLRLDPFTADLAQVVIDNEGTPIRATGRVEAREDGWHASVDATTERIGSDRVLAFWPVEVSPITRKWLSRNLEHGTMVEPSVALRAHTARKPEIELSFLFEDGNARFLPAMPHLTEATGRATLHDRRFTLAVDAGGMEAETGDRIDLGGSVFLVPDVRPKPVQGEITVVAKGPMQGMLSILDNPPLRIMERAKRPVDIAEAEADVLARITLPLVDGIKAEDVSYEVAATLSDVRSDSLVPGRVLEAETLEFFADPRRLGLEGAATLDGVALTARWLQPLGEAADEGGTIAGRLALSPDTVETFGLPLPDGFLRGESEGDYRLTLAPGAPPDLLLTSQMSGLTLSLPAVGWTKPAGETGTLTVAATLGDVPRVDRLELDTAGLSLRGGLDFGTEGFTGATFTPLRVGDWLDATVSLTPRGAGQSPAVALQGGTLDLRRLDLGGTGGGRGGGPIDLALDRLVVSDSISLTGVRGRIDQTAIGLSGEFRGQINGGAQVRGTLAPANAGTAIRIQSEDAAGVLASIGLTPNAREGTLDIVLTPVVGAPSGTYSGQFLIERIRIRKAPVMADLLDAISIVGLIDQLDGPGIRFESIDGSFRLTRDRLTLQQAAAVGGSIGISADGIYDMASKQLDMRGVISPVYFLNGIGSLFTRRGEGLFGFNYRMAGPTSDPSVSVNPLSILTPGAFRQIFRRAPPGG
ncbi:AsmA-like C-terminal region-containing protein [Silicimonas algicola]|nr:AsmA-like C-terminal region-containing protein [Silicimonas algicola]